MTTQIKHGCVKLCGTTTVGPKGQVVIPKEIRTKLNIEPGDHLAVLMKDDMVIGLVRNEDVEELIAHINSFNK